MKWEGEVTFEGRILRGNITMVGSQLRMAGCKAIACESMMFNRI